MEPSFRRPWSQWLRWQDLIWVVLFAAVLGFGPDQSQLTIVALIFLGLLQILEPKLHFFESIPGALISFGTKLALIYWLIGWSGGLDSAYHWLLLLPVLSASTYFGVFGTFASAIAVSLAYVSFIAFLSPTQYLNPDDIQHLILRLIGFSMVGFLTHELAESRRAEARRYQRVAEQLADANRDLEEAKAVANRSERLAALGQLSAGLAHELRNPLGTIKTSAEMLIKTVPADNEVACEMAEFISTEVDRTNSLVSRFLDFARPLAMRPEIADIRKVLDDAIRNVEQHRPPFDVAIYKNYSPDLRPFRFDPELMLRVFYNLILNAVQASAPKSSVTVKTRMLKDTVEISIIDRGSGIEKKHMESIFNPFFTTKPAGVGLGLAIVAKIVDEHGGRLGVESEPGSGTVFRLSLPTGEGIE
ncbi:MAG: hypothetical protein JO022_21985 [Acidobacteriaceae bacterium]|nr:hypothetical protein [Acidobacteriaceae bacterium]